MRLGGSEQPKGRPGVRVVITSLPHVFSYPGKEVWESPGPDARKASYPITSPMVFESLYTFDRRGVNVMRATTNQLTPLNPGSHIIELHGEDRTVIAVKYEIRKEP